MVLGILGLVALPVIGAILALVFGYQSRRETEANPHYYRDDFGQVGRVLGWVGLALTVVGAGIILLLFGFMFAAIPL